MYHTAFCDAELTLPQFPSDSIGKIFRQIIQVSREARRNYGESSTKHIMI